MKANEVRRIAFEFADDLVSGESLTGTPTIVELDTSVFTIGTPTIVGTQVVATIQATGATENTDYNLECLCPTDLFSGSVKGGNGIVKITRREGDAPAT